MDRQNDTRGIRLTGTEQHEHDTLAELFLGDAPYAPTPMSGAAPGQSIGSSPAPTPMISAGVPGDSGKDRPNPSKPTTSGASRYEGSAVRTMSPGDTEERPDGRPVVELVVLGHLPVRASLWVRQYACQAARNRCETVALVRTAGDSVAVDVITGGARAEIEPVESIEDAITIAKSAATRVIVRVDETAEPDLLGRGGIDEVTILTGADEAAVVASYRLIKSLVGTLDDRLDPDASPVLRVAVMGGSNDDIPAACMKIERACKAFLERPIEILDASGRIDATGTTSVCRIEGDGAAAAAIEALLVPTVTETRKGAMLRLADDADSDIDTDTGDALPEIVILPGAGLPRDARAASQFEPKPLGATGEDEANGEGEFLSDPAVPGVAVAMRPVATLGLRLPELIEGMSPIETRCPKAPGVWFACDPEGGLHVLAMDTIGNCVAGLFAARAWAMDNLALMLRAEPGLAMPSAERGQDDGVGLHLLSREPARWRGVMDTEVTVYAVASLTVGGEEHLVATALNT